MNNPLIRTYRPDDEAQVTALWASCNLVVPWNNAKRDIERKRAENPDQFFVAELEGRVIGTCMAGYDGHRGWIYYLAVDPGYRNRGIARSLMNRAEEELRSLGCPKIDLMVRRSNRQVIRFYERLGYREDPVLVMARRLIEDKDDGPP